MSYKPGTLVPGSWLSGADVDEYEEPDPADAFLALEDHHGTWLVTGDADDIMQYVDAHIKAEADRKAELKWITIFYWFRVTGRMLVVLTTRWMPNSDAF